MTKLVSYGAHYGGPAGADHVIDVRPRFGRNPYHDRQLRGLRGTDIEVQEDILQTPNFDANYAALKAEVATLSGVIYLGCTGGHHRSVYLVERLGRELGLPVEHRDIDKGRKALR